MFFCSEHILPNMHGFEVIHKLVYELRDSDFREVAVRLVANQPHCENVAQSDRDQIWILPNKQAKAFEEIFKSLLAFDKGFWGFHSIRRKITTVSLHAHPSSQ